jgi:hypothetical protein
VYVITSRVLLFAGKVLRSLTVWAHIDQHPALQPISVFPLLLAVPPPDPSDPSDPRNREMFSFMKASDVQDGQLTVTFSGQDAWRRLRNLEVSAVVAELLPSLKPRTIPPARKSIDAKPVNSKPVSGETDILESPVVNVTCDSCDSRDFWGLACSTWRMYVCLKHSQVSSSINFLCSHRYY